MGQAVNIGEIYADLNVDSTRMVDGLARGRQALAAIEAEIRAMHAELQAGALLIGDYMLRMDQLNKVERELAEYMRDANAKLGAAGEGFAVFNKQANAGATASQNLSRGLMQLGYMADDLQYGFSAIVNNIAPAVHALTGNAGLAAAAQVAAVAGIQLYNRWDEVQQAFGNTSGIDEATKSIEGMAEAVKKLKADAAGFSWSDALAWTLGANPDRGKALKAGGLAEALRGRKASEAAANSMEDGQTDAEKKEGDRYAEAVAQLGGTPELAKKIGQGFIDRGGARDFLSDKKAGGPLSFDRFNGATPTGSQKDEYDRLEADRKAGKLSGRDRGRLDDLKEIARQGAVAKAREMVGAGKIDRSSRDAVAGLIGGDEGEMLAGRKKTDKEIKKEAEEQARADNAADEKRKSQAAKDAAEKKKAEAEADRRRKAARDAEKRGRADNSEVAGMIIPRLPDLASREADRAHRGLQTPAESARRLAGALQGNGNEPGMNEGDARDAARDALDKANKEDPEKRKKRLANEDVQRAKELMPHAEKQMEAGVLAGLISGKGSGAMEKKIREKLVAEGMTADEAERATEGLTKGAKDKVSGHLAGMHGDEKPEKSQSETLATKDLTNRIQSSIGSGDDVKKQTSFQEKMVEYLDRLVKQDAVRIKVD